MKPSKNYLKNKNVLVYAKNKEGFVHDNISFAVGCLEKMAVERKIKVTIIDENLQSIDLTVFPSTNNEVLNSIFTRA